MFDPSSQRNAANPSSSSGSSGKPNIFAQPPAAPAAPTGPRPSTSSHSRRSSIQNLAAISQPQSPWQGGGEESMELESETDSEMDGSDDDDLVNQSLYLAPAPPQQDDDEEEEQSMEMTQNFGGGIINGDADESYDTSEANTSIQSDGSKTMDFTWAVGGILPTSAPENAQRGRASLGYSHLHPGEVEGTLIPGEGDDDEMEMDMDETRAFGGIIQPDDSLSSTEDTINHQHRERTQTFSINDLRAAAAEEQSAMDMTTAMGGIISQSQSQPPAQHERSINIFAQAQSQSQSRSSGTSTTTSTSATASLSVSVTTREPASPMPTTHQAPKSPMVGHQSITRPMTGTPSFARPTTASASKTRTRSPEKPKERRNIFGPSPSPFKSTTPRKSGMQTAGEVAKRLSFGSAAGSVSGSAKKRSRQSEVQEDGEDKEIDDELITGSPAKRQRLSQPRAPPLGDSVFGRPSLSMSVQEPSPPRTISAAPAPAPVMAAAPSPIRASTTPVKSVTRVTSTPGKSPKSPAIRRAMGVPVIPVEEERPDDWEPETIGLGAFLEMAGVQFIDTLPGMNRRRSSVGRGRLGQSGIGKGELLFGTNNDPTVCGI